MRITSFVSAALCCVGIAACAGASEDQVAESNGNALGGRGDQVGQGQVDQGPATQKPEAAQTFAASPSFGAAKGEGQQGFAHAADAGGGRGAGPGAGFDGKRDCDGGFDADGGAPWGIGEGFGEKPDVAHGGFDADGGAPFGEGRGGPGGEGVALGAQQLGDAREQPGAGSGTGRVDGAGEHCDGGAVEGTGEFGGRAPLAP